jgi:hypothetical protein
LECLALVLLVSVHLFFLRLHDHSAAAVAVCRLLVCQRVEEGEEAAAILGVVQLGDGAHLEARRHVVLRERKTERRRKEENERERKREEGPLTEPRPPRSEPASADLLGRVSTRLGLHNNSSCIRHSRSPPLLC